MGGAEEFPQNVTTVANSASVPDNLASVTWGPFFLHRELARVFSRRAVADD